MEKFLDEYGLIFIATACGFICRLSMIKVDYRQYPSYPQSYFSHLMLGFIAAVIGAVFIPSIIEENYTAVTFLTVAGSQFREIRSVEREALAALEKTELVRRGNAYIEDIAKKFESRNYATIATSILISIIYVLADQFLNKYWTVTVCIVSAVPIILLFHHFMKSKTLLSIAEVSKTEIYFDGQLMKSGDVILMNIGLKSSREIIEKSVIGLKIHPVTMDAINVISNLGQRQAVLHNICACVGIRRDEDEPDFIPIAKRVPENGDIVIAFMPLKRDESLIIKAVTDTPILESAKH